MAGIQSNTWHVRSMLPPNSSPALDPWANGNEPTVTVPMGEFWHVYRIAVSWAPGACYQAQLVRGPLAPVGSWDELVTPSYGTGAAGAGIEIDDRHLLLNPGDQLVLVQNNTRSAHLSDPGYGDFRMDYLSHPTPLLTWG